MALRSGRYRLSRQTAAALAQLEAALPLAPAAHVDETSWRQAGTRGWLWVVVGTALTVFRVAQSRGRA